MTCQDNVLVNDDDTSSSCKKGQHVVQALLMVFYICISIQSACCFFFISVKIVDTIHSSVDLCPLYKVEVRTLSDSAVHRCFACLCDGHAVRQKTNVVCVMVANVWNSLVNDISSLLTFCVKPKTHFYRCLLVMNMVICASLY